MFTFALVPLLFSACGTSEADMPDLSHLPPPKPVRPHVVPMREGLYSGGDVRFFGGIRLSSGGLARALGLPNGKNYYWHERDRELLREMNFDGVWSIRSDGTIVLDSWPKEGQAERLTLDHEGLWWDRAGDDKVPEHWGWVLAYGSDSTPDAAQPLATIAKPLRTLWANFVHQPAPWWEYGRRDYDNLSPEIREDAERTRHPEVEIGPIPGHPPNLRLRLLVPHNNNPKGFSGAELVWIGQRSAEGTTRTEESLELSFDCLEVGASLPPATWNRISPGGPPFNYIAIDTPYEVGQEKQPPPFNVCPFGVPIEPWVNTDRRDAEQERYIDYGGWFMHMYETYRSNPERWAWYMRCPQVEGCTWPPAPPYPGFMGVTAPDYFKHLVINDSNENIYPGPIVPGQPSPDLPGWQTPPMSP